MKQKKFAECPECGERFEKTRVDRVFCSNLCTLRSRRKFDRRAYKAYEMLGDIVEHPRSEILLKKAQYMMQIWTLDPLPVPRVHKEEN